MRSQPPSGTRRRTRTTSTGGKRRRPPRHPNEAAIFGVSLAVFGVLPAIVVIAVVWGHDIDRFIDLIWNSAAERFTGDAVD